MNSFDFFDVIIIAMIFLPVIVFSYLARLYFKEGDEIELFSKHLSSQLNIDKKFTIDNISDNTLIFKKIAIYIALAGTAYQVYDINSTYVLIIPVVSLLVVFGFYGKNSGIDENVAARMAMKLLDKISEANRIGDQNKLNNLSLMIDYIIAKFNLNKTGDVFVSQSYISFQDTLSGNERSAYIAKNLVRRIYFSLKVLLPIVAIIIVTILLKAAAK
jgi:hypothetical protein